MRTQLTFRSEKFPPDPDEEELVNPGLWGRRLARYLEQALEDRGIATGGIGSEDWGWLVHVENADFPIWIGCGHQNGDADEFLCFLHPDRPWVRRWLRRIETRPVLERLADALESILSSDPKIRELRWEGGGTEPGTKPPLSPRDVP